MASTGCLCRGERLLTPLRDTLGDDEFRAQWATGQALPLADAIAYGLGRTNTYQEDR